MRTLSRDQLTLLSGAPSELTPEERALDAAIAAHARGVRFAFDAGRLAIRPPRGQAVPGDLLKLLASDRDAVRLAGALVIVAEMAGIHVTTLSRLPVRYQFLGAYGAAAQSLADGAPVQ